MKINLGKLVKVIGHMIAAAPVVIAVAKPIVAELKRPSQPAR